MKAVEDRIHVTELVCKSKGFSALCMKLNDLLGSRTNHLKIWLEPVIPPVLWKDWFGSTEIAQALKFLQKSLGIHGLKYFRDVLTQMGEVESLATISNSNCAHMFRGTVADLK